MKKMLIAFVLGCVVVAGVAYAFIQKDTVLIQDLKNEVTTTKESLLGYTKYTDYISAGKKVLSEQMKFLAATVNRPQSIVEKIEARYLKGLVGSDAAVKISYAVEYSFGFDLSPTDYDVINGPKGIEIRLKKPILVASPAVSGLQYEILSKGIFTDEKAAVLRLYEGASKNAKAQGMGMTHDPAIIALCEKKLIEFLHDFLSKQPGVKIVPAIMVAYKS